MITLNKYILYGNPASTRRLQGTQLATRRNPNWPANLPPFWWGTPCTSLSLGGWLVGDVVLEGLEGREQLIFAAGF